MDKNYIVSIKGTQIVNSSVDTVYVEEPCLYKKSDNYAFISFVCSDKSKNVIEIDKNGIVTLMRHSDEIQSKMMFEKDKKHTCTYCTKYGKIEMDIDLKEVNCNLNNGGGSIELHYTLRTGIEFLSENVTVIKIKEENKSV